MDFNDEFLELIKSKTKCIWINSFEIERVIANISFILNENIPSMNLYTWNAYTGVESTFDDNFKICGNNTNSPRKVFDIIKDKTLECMDKYSENDLNNNFKQREQAVFILKNFHLFLNSKDILSALLELKESSYDRYFYSPIIVISPLIDIPLEAEKLFTVLNFDTPSKNEIRNYIGQFIEQRVVNNLSNEENFELSKNFNICIDYCYGLTLNEITNYLYRSLWRYKTLKPDIFKQARIDLINKTGILQYKECNVDFNSMGGNEIFKNWILDIRNTFSKEAEEFGVEKSKGYLSLGVPGTAKTQAAEMIATMLNLPLLKFNMSSIMHSHVGQSERNMASAINVIKACSPCVLLIDEIEKTFSGTSSSGATDGGTLMRVFGQLLEFLSDDSSKNVFTVMTSNNASQLPPELTRSGRLDIIWYFGLPSFEERKEIFKIHFSKTKLNYNENIIDFCANITENFTGAEIKEIVKIINRKVFNSYIQNNSNIITDEIILKSKEEVIPVFQSSKEKIIALENYAKYRARFSSKYENKEKSKNIFSYNDFKF